MFAMLLLNVFHENLWGEAGTGIGDRFIPPAGAHAWSSSWHTNPQIPLFWNPTVHYLAHKHTLLVSKSTL